MSVVSRKELLCWSYGEGKSRRSTELSELNSSSDSLSLLKLLLTLKLALLIPPEPNKSPLLSELKKLLPSLLALRSPLLPLNDASFSIPLLKLRLLKLLLESAAAFTASGSQLPQLVELALESVTLLSDWMLFNSLDMMLLPLLALSIEDGMLKTSSESNSRTS